jgi:hypothetical protein
MKAGPDRQYRARKCHELVKWAGAAQRWLRRHLAHAGRRSSVDLARLFA